MLRAPLAAVAGLAVVMGGVLAGARCDEPVEDCDNELDDDGDDDFDCEDEDCRAECRPDGGEDPLGEGEGE